MTVNLGCQIMSIMTTWVAATLWRISIVNTDSFRFVGYPVRVHAGPDSINSLTGELDRINARRALVVCGNSVANKTNLVDRVNNALGDRIAEVFSGGKTGSPLTSVLEGVAAAKKALSLIHISEPTRPY